MIKPEIHMKRSFGRLMSIAVLVQLFIIVVGIWQADIVTIGVGLIGLNALAVGYIIYKISSEKLK